MKAFFFILLSSLAISTQAKNYYFSSESGNDSRSSTEAQNSSTPWKSLDKLNSFFSSLRPGDFVYLKRGEMFYGSINIKISGTTSSPITISAFGTGDKPIITGFKKLSSWNSVGNGIYESYNSSLNTTLNMVLINGVQQGIGRYPNLDAAIGGYLYFESHSGTTSITDNQLTSSTNWTGAEVVVRQRRWKLDRATITSHSGSKITNTGLSGTPYDDYGYFIQDHIKTLDQFGEWYYNSSSNKLSVYFGSASPSSYEVEAATIDDLIYNYNYSNIVFDNLAFEGANEYSFNINNGSNFYIKNCNITYSGIDAVTVNNHNDFKIEDCNISNSNNNGINLGHGDYAVVRNNKIINTALFAGMGLSGDGNGVGINSYGNNNLVEYNQVLNTGYIPISFRADYVTIKNNFIDGFCSVKDDGGGIYTYGSSNTEMRKGRKLIGNIIMNGVGAELGTDNTGLRSAQGIYMDANASGVEIRDNTITNVVRGLYLHSAHDIIVRNNTFFNNTSHQVYMKEEPDLAGMRNNILANNILFAKYPSTTVLTVKSSKNDINLFGKFDSNYYARPLNDRLIVASSYIKSSGTPVSQSLDLEGWKDKYNKDANSKRTAKQIAPYKLIDLIGSSRIANGTFSSLNDVDGSSCSLSLGGSGLLDGDYLQVNPTDRGSSVRMDVGSIKAGKNYIVRYSVRGSVDSSMAIGAFLRQGDAPYENLTITQYRKVSTSRTDYELIFSPASSNSSTRLVFQVDDENKFYLDNVKFYEADAIITNPDDSIRFEYNASNTSKSITLNDDYIDVKNNSYTNSVTLKPYASIVLIRTKASETSGNLAPKISITSPDNNASFSSSSSIRLSADASDADGSVSKVDFYNGSTLLKSEEEAPYAWDWDNVDAGDYTITAKAYDNDGAVTSSSVDITVTGSSNSRPVVNITSPSNNASYKAPASIRLSADASDADGSISKVEFYNGSTLLTTEEIAPYEWDWDNVDAGDYTITAKAYDNDGAVTSSTVDISVTDGSSSNIRPTVNLTSPSNNASYSGPASIRISADASDADGSISKVEFYNGSTLLNTQEHAPYEWNWNNAEAGEYSITAKAYDNDGSVASSSVDITVNGASNGNPTVTLTNPLNNAQFNAGSDITVSADASDPDGSIIKVELYNGTQLLATENYYKYSWTWKDVEAGDYTIKAKAYDDEGNVTTSAPVNISVVNNTLSRVARPSEVSSTTAKDSSYLPSTRLSDFQLFPNPAVNTIEMNFQSMQSYQKANLSIIALSGSIVKTIPLVLTNNNKVKVDVSTLIPGMYIIRISNDNFLINKKFIKAK